MVSIILSHPQMGENIGAAARAMRNFGLTDLRLIKPRDGWPNPAADTTSAGAFEQMRDVLVFDNLESAIKDLHFVFGTTARSRDMVKPIFTPQTAITESYKRISDNQRIGIMFGAERTGLLNDEVSACQAIINIPTASDFSSLNLGQAVLLMAYEWMRQQEQLSHQPNIEYGDSLPALQKDIQNFISRLEQDLEERRFFRSEDLRPTMRRNIQNIFNRADISDQELRTLHGVLSALRGNKTQQ